MLEKGKRHETLKTSDTKYPQCYILCVHIFISTFRNSHERLNLSYIILDKVRVTGVILL